MLTQQHIQSDVTGSAYIIPIKIPTTFPAETENPFPNSCGTTRGPKYPK